jgi:hypothetical protein
MALLKLKQLSSPLSYASGTLSVSASFTVTGSSTFVQTTGSIPAIASSGSVYVVNSKNITTGSLEGNPVDGGSF